MSILNRFWELFKSKHENEEYSNNDETQKIEKESESVDKLKDTFIPEPELKDELIKSKNDNHIEQEIIPEDQIEERKPEEAEILDKEDLEIVIGFDFGTSCLKVVLRDVPRDISYVVDFEEYGHKSNTLLLPTQIYLDKRNIFNLKKGKTRISEDIKINLIDKPYEKLLDDLTNVDIAIAYLGCAFRRIREWFEKSIGDIYKNNNIIWQINIGMPARDYSDSKLVELFRYVALLGWEMSIGTDEISVQQIHNVVTKVPNLNSKSANRLSIHPDDVYAIPEIIAAVIGYAKSRMRKNGMFFLMDIGASTVDISMFNLYKRDDEGIKYSILWAELGRFGVLSRFRLEIDSLSSEVRQDLINKLNLYHCVDPIPEIRPHLQKKDRYIIDEAELKITTDLRNLIGGVIKKVKIDRNPYDFAWKNGIPIFITGGGSEIEYYRNQLLNKFSELSNMNISRPKIVDLPNPRDLKISGQSMSVIKRFSSAYGLSYRESDIGTIIDAGSIEDISKEEIVVDYSGRYLSKDLM